MQKFVQRHEFTEFLTGRLQLVIERKPRSFSKTAPIACIRECGFLVEITFLHETFREIINLVAPLLRVSGHQFDSLTLQESRSSYPNQFSNFENFFSIKRSILVKLLINFARPSNSKQDRTGYLNWHQRGLMIV